MSRTNIFDGDSYKAQFAIIAYRQLMSRQWVANADIMAEYLGLKSASELPYTISKCEHVKELSKALMDIKDALGRCNVKEEGNNKSRRFLYIGEDNDPLADMLNAKVINNLRQYWEFCQDSSGFFPTSWLEYFFKGCQDLLDIKAKRRRGEQLISSSLDRILTNIEFLPSLYEAIKNQVVLEIDYKPFEEESSFTLIFHPHYLKEYNGRWHLLGHAEGRTPEYGYNIPIDRIQSRPHERPKIEYKQAPKYFYEGYFKDIVGVSHKYDATKEHVVIRARSLYIYKLIDTKPIHESHTLVKPFAQYEDGKYAEFSVDVEPNNEFYGRILQMGAGLEIVSPENVRYEMAQRVQDLADLYDKNR